MLPLWPSINPSLIGSLILNNGNSEVTNEEQEIRWGEVDQNKKNKNAIFPSNSSALEEEQQNYLNLFDTIAQEITPLGKTVSEQNNEDSDESGESDGGESSASEDVDEHDVESDNDNEHIELSQ